MSHAALIEQLSALTPAETGQLASDLRELLGVKAAQPGQVQPAPGNGPAPVAAEKTEFSVELVAIGLKKVNVIKAVREITALGLIEAKTLTERAPVVVVEGLSKTNAEAVVAKLQAEGATAVLK